MMKLVKHETLNDSISLIGMEFENTSGVRLVAVSQVLADGVKENGYGRNHRTLLEAAEADLTWRHISMGVSAEHAQRLTAACEVLRLSYGQEWAVAAYAIYLDRQPGMQGAKRIAELTWQLFEERDQKALEEFRHRQDLVLLQMSLKVVANSVNLLAIKAGLAKS